MRPYSWYTCFRKDCPKGELNLEAFQGMYKQVPFKQPHGACFTDFPFPPQFFPYGDPTRFSEFAFKVFDADNNGKLNFAEFMAGLSVTARGSLEEKLECAPASGLSHPTLARPLGPVSSHGRPSPSQ